jgi:type IV secretory pathway VirJ component
MPQFRKAFSKIAARADKEDPALIAKLNGKSDPLSDLPLIEVPAAGADTNMMAVIITGDGGWGVTDRGIGRSLAAKGIPVVGLNSLQYFWTRRTPEKTAADLERILQHYSVLWNRPRVVMIGYSFGADVLPFLLNRISRESLLKIEVVAFLGLSSTADFQFHLTDWLVSLKRATALPVRPELEKLRGKKILCFYGTEDKDALCGELDPGLAKSIAIQSGHRFGNDYQPIVDAILQEIR